jgi:hypothetical protein
VGFQYTTHNGRFLAAALSGLASWIVGAIMKRHQMRFCLRMCYIEVHQYGHISGKDQPCSSEDVGEDALPPSSPLIDYSWFYTEAVYNREVKAGTGQS